MAKTLLKNSKGEILDLDGRHVLVSGAGGENNIEAELSAMKSRMDNLLAAADAMVFKGVVNNTATLPDAGYRTGWTYKVGVAGTYAGQSCEAGDMIICVSDCGETAADADWQVMQTNIDGAVTGPAASTNGNLAVFNSGTGKVIADSAIKQTDVASAVELKHEHANAAALATLALDDKNNLTVNGKAVCDALVDCVVINAGDEIPANLRENGIIFEIQAETTAE